MKNFLDLLPKNTRYAPDEDVYGNLEGYISFLESMLKNTTQALEFERDAFRTRFNQERDEYKNFDLA